MFDRNDTESSAQAAFEAGIVKRALSPIALPIGVLEQIESEQIERRAKLDAEYEAERAAEEAARKEESAQRKAKTSNDTNPFRDLNIEKCGPCPPGHVAIVQLEGLEEEGRGLKATYSERYDKERYEALGNHLREKGIYRELIPVPATWRERLVALLAAMPNLAGLVEFLRAELVWSSPDQPSPRIPPVLLVGPPGVGKSVAAERLASVMDAPLMRIQIESAETGSTLSGSSHQWANSSPGGILRALLFGVTGPASGNRRVANPYLMIDEIDKAKDDRGESLAAFYSLWEIDSAKYFVDSSYPNLKIDASWVRFVCTANSLERIPLPLLSRMQIIEVPAFTTEQGIRLVQTLYGEFSLECERLLGRALAPLAEGIAMKLSKSSPRVMKRILRNAIGRAMYEGRDHVVAEDLAVGLSMAKSDSDVAAELNGGLS